MKYWAVSAGDKSWAVKLDIRDLGGHVDITRRARAGTLSGRAVKATSQVHLVSALPSGLLRLVGLVRSMFLPAGLHGSEGAAVSKKNLDSFRSGKVRACWPRKLPMANRHAVLSLRDATEGCDFDYHVIWGRFRQLRRYLGCRLGEALGFIGSWTLLPLEGLGMDLFSCFWNPLVNWGLLGTLLRRSGLGQVFPLPPRILAGPYPHFKSAIKAAWRVNFAGLLITRTSFRGCPRLDYEGTKQLLFSSHLRERDKMLLRSILCGGTWNGFLLGKSKEEDVLCRYCVCVGGIAWGWSSFFWGELPSPLSWFAFGSSLNLLLCFPVTAAPGLAAWPGMVGCLHSLPADLTPLGRWRRWTAQTQHW